MQLLPLSFAELLIVAYFEDVNQIKSNLISDSNGSRVSMSYVKHSIYLKIWIFVIFQEVLRKIAWHGGQHPLISHDIGTVVR